MARGKTKVYLKMYLEESQAERLESVKKITSITRLETNHSNGITQWSEAYLFITNLSSISSINFTFYNTPLTNTRTPCNNLSLL